MAYVSKETIDDIKTHNDIVDVIGSYIDLSDRLKALCPFHDDHAPSFSVQKEKQIFKCFSCGASGNVITFVQRIEGCTYAEALQKLADRAGIKVNLGVTKQVNKELLKYYEINNVVNNYFKNNLSSSSGKTAMQYLIDRGLSKELISDFDIGLASGNKLGDILKSKFKIEELISCDIVKEYNGGFRDSFQNRIIFPIFDEDCNILGFSGRKYLELDLKNEELPKYYNTKETKAFVKSNILYNINNAKEYIKKKGEIIITEGYMDVIRLWSIGYKNVIAIMGTAFTKEHLEKISKLKCKVVLNLDQDNAGKNGTLVIGDELAKNSIETSVILFDKYKDSDDFILNKGKEAFDVAYNNRVAYIDFKLKQLKSKNNMKDATEISKYINDAIKSINELNDDILKELKIKELSDEFDVDESILRGKIKKTLVTKKINEEIKKPQNKYDKYSISEIRIIYLMLNYEDVILMFENSLGGLIRENMSHLAYKIIEFKHDYGYFNISDFIDYISESEELNSTLEDVMKYPNNENYTEAELDDYIKTIKEHSVKKRIELLKKEMNETLDINKKIEIAKKIENMNKEVLEW